MAILIQSYTSNSIEVSSNITLTKPTGSTIAVGDLLLIIVANDYISSGAQWDDVTYKPAGFNLITTGGNPNSDSYIAAFWRIADGTETATINVESVDPFDYVGFYIHITGNSNTPINSFATPTIALGLPSTVTSINTTVANCLSFALLASDGSDLIPFSFTGTGWSKIAEDGINGSAGVGLTFGTKSIPAAGATGDVIVDSSATDENVHFQFSIEPSLNVFEVREKLFDNSGVEYANGTIVYCYDINGNLLLSGTVGTITGTVTDTGVPLVSGEVSFTFSENTQVYLTVKPNVDVFGLITNFIDAILL